MYDLYYCEHDTQPCYCRQCPCKDTRTVTYRHNQTNPKYEFKPPPAYVGYHNHPHYCTTYETSRGDCTGCKRKCNPREWK